MPKNEKFKLNIFFLLCLGVKAYNPYNTFIEMFHKSTHQDSKDRILKEFQTERKKDPMCDCYSYFWYGSKHTGRRLVSTYWMP